MNQKQAHDFFVDYVNETTENTVEYESTHVDAGNAYGHMLSEGAFDYYNCSDLCNEWLIEEFGAKLSKEDLEEFCEEMIQWHDLKSGHIFSTPQKSESGLDLCSFPVGECEIPFTQGDLFRAFKFEFPQENEKSIKAYVESFIESAISGNITEAICLSDNNGGLYAYENTDAVWTAFVTHETAKDALLRGWLQKKPSGDQAATK